MRTQYRLPNKRELGAWPTFESEPPPPRCSANLAAFLSDKHNQKKRRGQGAEKRHSNVRAKLGALGSRWRQLRPSGCRASAERTQPSGIRLVGQFAKLSVDHSFRRIRRQRNCTDMHKKGRVWVVRWWSAFVHAISSACVLLLSPIIIIFFCAPAPPSVFRCIYQIYGCTSCSNYVH